MAIDFPTSPAVNDLYTLGSRTWKCVSITPAVWQAVSTTAGPQGTQGTQGTQGVQSIATQGTQGTQGILGAQGATGAQGVQGTQGTQGIQGIQGGFAFALGTGVQTFLTTPTSANLAGALTDETGTGANVFGTGPTISLPLIDNIKLGYTTTVTSGTPYVLTAASNNQQFFTGTTAQTVTLPVTSTLVLGLVYIINNNSTAVLTLNSSGGNLATTVGAGEAVTVTCIGTALTTAADWDVALNRPYPDPYVSGFLLGGM